MKAIDLRPGDLHMDEFGLIEVLSDPHVLLSGKVVVWVAYPDGGQGSRVFDSEETETTYYRP